jgi:hypothetical protein
MVLFGQITTNMTSPVVQVGMLAASGLVLFVVVKIGGFISKMLLGLALLGGVIWWFLSKLSLIHVGFALLCWAIVPESGGRFFSHRSKRDSGLKAHDFIVRVALARKVPVAVRIYERYLRPFALSTNTLAPALA